MSERLKSVKIPFSAWQALTRLCAATGEPRTRQLAKIIDQAERQSQSDVDQKLLDWITTYTRLEIDGAAHRALVALVKGQQE